MAKEVKVPNLSALQEFVFYRTYSRWVEELQRRETWDEAVDRYFKFFEGKFKTKVPEKVWVLCRQNMRSMGTMASMRAFWTAGPALEASNVAGYNCCAIVIKDLRSFAELFYVLMCGTGVGFSVERQFVDRLPVVAPQTAAGLGVYVVQDSKEGWADSLLAGLEAWFSGKDIEFDYSQVRPRGARLKTMGGRASGPDPLKELHQTVRQIVLSAQGRKLRRIECLDIGNKIAEVVVVGGVRRSSEITFSDLDDIEIRDAKDFSKGPFPTWRYMSNNSAVYNGKPEMVTFMKEWTALAASGSGERGIFNAKSATMTAPRRNPDKIYRTNPCVAGDTEILTKVGYRRIDSLVGKTIEVWNGFEWSAVEPRVTGHNQRMVDISFSSGQFLRCTEGHNFWIATDYNGGKKMVSAMDLEIGMKLIKTEMPVVYEGRNADHAYAQGFISGDGMDDYKHFLLYNTKYMCIDRLEAAGCHVSPEEHTAFGRKNVTVKFDPQPKDFVPFEWNFSSRLDWLAGIIDSDGTELKEGGLQISSINQKFLLQTQKMLTTLGVTSKVTKGRKGGKRLLPDGHGGNKAYYCQADYRLLVGATQMQFLKDLGLTCERMKFNKTPSRDASQFVTVTGIEGSDVEETVYCFTEEKRHLGCFEGVVTGQCGEIMLRAEEGQFCNLTEVVVRAEDTFATLTSKTKSAVWLGAMQACLTDFPYLRKSFKESCEEERLLGVSLTGQMDNPKLMTEGRLSDLKEIAIEECEKACAALGINMSVAITTGKPSGTVSQLVNAASGAHPRFAKYYIRRVRISAGDPLCRMLRDQGVPMTPENGEGPDDIGAKRKQLLDQGFEDYQVKIMVPEWVPDSVKTWVVSFPEKAPVDAITRHDVSAIDQLEWYKKVRLNWCEHNQSITVYVRDDEWFEVGNWVYKNFDIISGVSFLPFDGGSYKQAPYEDLSREEYLKMLKAFPKIDYGKLSVYEQEDNTTGAQALACSGTSCEIA